LPLFPDSVGKFQRRQNSAGQGLGATTSEFLPCLQSRLFLGQLNDNRCISWWYNNNLELLAYNNVLQTGKERPIFYYAYVSGDTAKIDLRSHS